MTTKISDHNKGDGAALTDLTITNNAEGHAVVTGYGDDASITLEGVDASALTDADFDFLGG
ncbi:hypothetical protein [Hoeflea sp.]|uniref:hypothetical protein n=1 Tax=Hoeflea sp. TaxID=1940281 RepID=UPI003B01F5F3